jgi:hypothetical protein
LLVVLPVIRFSRQLLTSNTSGEEQQQQIATTTTTAPPPLRLAIPTQQQWHMRQTTAAKAKTFTTTK